MPKNQNTGAEESANTEGAAEANAGANPGTPPAAPNNSQKPPEQPKRVRVLVEGTLGPLLLTKGDVTDDPDYVAILDVKGQKRVELVK